MINAGLFPIMPRNTRSVSFLDLQKPSSYFIYIVMKKMLFVKEVTNE
jgi:hypothetical protein